jgi:hypothetical protein
MPRIHQSLLPKAVLAAGLLISAGAAFDSSAVINYPDQSDIPPGTVTYSDIVESSSTNLLPPGLYGAPSINGDLLDFDPVGFGANSNSGAFALTDGQLNFTVTAEPGAAINSLIVSEGGDFSFQGLVPDAGTFVSVSVLTTVNILEVDGVTLGTPIEISQVDSLTTDYLTVGNPPASGLNLWSLDYTIDILGAITGPTQLGATKIEVVIDNQLSSKSTADTQAFLSKKDFNVNIPEPTSIALLSFGGLLLARRRRA